MFKRNIILSICIVITLTIMLFYGYSYIHNKNRSNFHGYDIENGNFFSTSSDGKAYNLKANSITNIGKKMYKLNKVYGQYFMDKNNDKYTEVISEAGAFNELKNLLHLKGNVEFILSEGYRMITDDFYIDMNKNIASTKEEVLLSGTQGKILSKNGMIVYMKKKKIILHGPIQSVFVENNITS